MIEGILIEGFIYGIMALGVFITFRILDFPDMTVDGSFPLGAAVVAIMISSGYHFTTALMVAFICGLLAGSITAIIHITLKVHTLMSGILTLTMLYSINLRVLGNKANLPLYNKETVFSWINRAAEGVMSVPLAEAIFFGVIIILVKILLDLFFATDMGLAMISMGDNPKMVVTLGINDNAMKLIGVSLANGMVAISGGFAAMYLGFGDINLGQGIIISGLASVMIGEFVIRRSSMFAQTFRVVLGCIIYKAVMYGGREFASSGGIAQAIKFSANDLKFLTGLLLILCLALTRITSKKGKY